MDREAWRAAVHGVAKSWTWQLNWTEMIYNTHRSNLIHLPVKSAFLFLLFKLFHNFELTQKRYTHTHTNTNKISLKYFFPPIIVFPLNIPNVYQATFSFFLLFVCLFVCCCCSLWSLSYVALFPGVRCEMVTSVSLFLLISLPPENILEAVWRYCVHLSNLRSRKVNKFIFKIKVTGNRIIFWFLLKYDRY